MGEVPTALPRRSCAVPMGKYPIRTETNWHRLGSPTSKLGWHCWRCVFAAAHTVQLCRPAGQEVGLPAGQHKVAMPAAPRTSTLVMLDLMDCTVTKAARLAV